MAAIIQGLKKLRSDTKLNVLKSYSCTASTVKLYGNDVLITKNENGKAIQVIKNNTVPEHTLNVSRIDVCNKENEHERKSKINANSVDRGLGHGNCSLMPTMKNCLSSGWSINSTKTVTSSLPNCITLPKNNQLGHRYIHVKPIKDRSRKPYSSPNILPKGITRSTPKRKRNVTFPSTSNYISACSGKIYSPKNITQCKNINENTFKGTSWSKLKFELIKKGYKNMLDEGAPVNEKLREYNAITPPEPIENQVTGTKYFHRLANSIIAYDKKISTSTISTRGEPKFIYNQALPYRHCRRLHTYTSGSEDQTFSSSAKTNKINNMYSNPMTRYTTMCNSIVYGNDSVTETFNMNSEDQISNSDQISDSKSHVIEALCTDVPSKSTKQKESFIVDKRNLKCETEESHEDLKMEVNNIYETYVNQGLKTDSSIIPSNKYGDISKIYDLDPTNSLLKLKSLMNIFSPEDQSEKKMNNNELSKNYDGTFQFIKTSNPRLVYIKLKSRPNIFTPENIEQITLLITEKLLLGKDKLQPSLHLIKPLSTTYTSINNQSKLTIKEVSDKEHNNSLNRESNTLTPIKNQSKLAIKEVIDKELKFEQIKKERNTEEKDVDTIADKQDMRRSLEVHSISLNPLKKNILNDNSYVSDTLTKTDKIDTSIQDTWLPKQEPLNDSIFKKDYATTGNETNSEYDSKTLSHKLISKNHVPSESPKNTQGLTTKQAGILKESVKIMKTKINNMDFGLEKCNQIDRSNSQHINKLSNEPTDTKRPRSQHADKLLGYTEISKPKTTHKNTQLKEPTYKNSNTLHVNNLFQGPTDIKNHVKKFTSELVRKLLKEHTKIRSPSSEHLNTISKTLTDIKNVSSVYVNKGFKESIDIKEQNESLYLNKGSKEPIKINDTSSVYGNKSFKESTEIKIPSFEHINKLLKESKEIERSNMKCIDILDKMKTNLKSSSNSRIEKVVENDEKNSNPSYVGMFKGSTDNERTSTKSTDIKRPSKIPEEILKEGTKIKGPSSEHSGLFLKRPTEIDMPDTKSTDTLYKRHAEIKSMWFNRKHSEKLLKEPINIKRCRSKHVNMLLQEPTDIKRSNVLSNHRTMIKESQLGHNDVLLNGPTDNKNDDMLLSGPTYVGKSKNTINIDELSKEMTDINMHNSDNALLNKQATKTEELKIKSRDELLKKPKMEKSKSLRHVESRIDLSHPQTYSRKIDESQTSFLRILCKDTYRYRRNVHDAMVELPPINVLNVRNTINVRNDIYHGNKKSHNHGLNVEDHEKPWQESKNTRQNGGVKLKASISNDTLKVNDTKEQTDVLNKGTNNYNNKVSNNESNLNKLVTNQFKKYKNIGQRDRNNNKSIKCFTKPTTSDNSITHLHAIETIVLNFKNNLKNTIMNKNNTPPISVRQTKRAFISHPQQRDIKTKSNNNSYNKSTTNKVSFMESGKNVYSKKVECRNMVSNFHNKQKSNNFALSMNRREIVISRPVIRVTGIKPNRVDKKPTNSLKKHKNLNHYNTNKLSKINNNNNNNNNKLKDCSVRKIAPKKGYYMNSNKSIYSRQKTLSLKRKQPYNFNRMLNPGEHFKMNNLPLSIDLLRNASFYAPANVNSHKATEINPAIKATNVHELNNEDIIDESLLNNKISRTLRNNNSKEKLGYETGYVFDSKADEDELLYWQYYNAQPKSENKLKVNNIEMMNKTKFNTSLNVKPVSLKPFKHISFTTSKTRERQSSKMDFTNRSKDKEKRTKYTIPYVTNHEIKHQSETNVKQNVKNLDIYRKKYKKLYDINYSPFMKLKQNFENSYNKTIENTHINETVFIRCNSLLAQRQYQNMEVRNSLHEHISESMYRTYRENIKKNSVGERNAFWYGNKV